MANPETTGRRIGIQDAAEYLGVSRRSIYNLIAAGKLDARKFSTRTLLDFDEVTGFAGNLPPARIKQVAGKTLSPESKPAA